MQDPKSGKSMPKLWNKKPIAVLQAEAADVATQELMTHGRVPLKRTLSAMSLMALGIDNIIAAGIFDGAANQRSTAMSNKSNSTVATMGIDIGKNSFHVVGLDQRGPQSCCGRSGREGIG